MSEINVSDELKKLVLSEYLRLSQSERRINDEVKEAWNQNRKKIDKFLKDEQQRQKKTKAVWVHKTDYPPHVSCMKKAEVVGSDGSVQILPIKTINAIPPIPKVSTWVPTKQNIFVKDETVLHNIPYSGEKSEDEEPFVNEVLDKYEGKVHGGMKSGFLDDQIFVELVHALVDNQKKIERKTSKQNKNNDDDENSDDIFPSSVIFQAISAEFPDKGNPKKLYEKYISLTGKKDPNVLPVECIPNIDGPNAESLPRERTMSSFLTLFCPRCFTYDCLKHPLDTQLGPNLQKRKGPEMKPSDKPCGPNCYQHVSAKLAQQNLKEEQCETDSGNSSVSSRYSLRKKVSKQKSVDSGNEASSSVSSGSEVSAAAALNITDLIKPDSTWTGSDQSMFRALRAVFPNNYCVISEMMLTKTCEQVYQFALQEAETPVAETPVAETSRKSNRPKKYKKNRLVLPKRSKSKPKDTSNIHANNFNPCSHPGKDCEKSNCPCTEANNFCEKFCHCKSDCKNRYRGCKCKKGHCNTKLCSCYYYNRECDPDQCKNCGADQFETSEICCKNVSIQRGLRKHILQGQSDIAGWGIFLNETVQKDELISEYCGEIISQEEAERRGLIYDKLGCSYLFNLNNDYVVDAARKGNKIRFANHSVNPNCYAKIMMVNGDHRIGIYAKRDMEPGEEVLFDYSYKPEAQLKFVPIERQN